MDNGLLLTRYERVIINELFFSVDMALKANKGKQATFTSRTALLSVGPDTLDALEQAFNSKLLELVTDQKVKQAINENNENRLLPPDEKGLKYPKQISARFWDMLKPACFTLHLEIDKPIKTTLQDGELPVFSSFWEYKIYKKQTTEQAIYEYDDKPGTRLFDGEAAAITDLVGRTITVNKGAINGFVYHFSPEKKIDQVKEILGLDYKYIDSFDMLMLTQLALFTQRLATRWEAQKTPIKDTTITNVVVPGDKATKTLFNAIDSFEKSIVSVSGSKSKPISIAVSLAFENISISKKLTAYDKAVFSAVISIYKRQVQDGIAEHFCTVKQVYEAMVGQDYTNFVKDDALAAVEASLHKMRTALITIDATEQMQTWDKGNATNRVSDEYKKNGKVVFSGYLMPIEYLQGPDRNGNKVTLYKIIKKPGLLDYAEALGQVIDFPINWLSIKYEKDGKLKALSTTTNNTLFARLLCERLKVLQNKIHNKTVTDNDAVVMYQHFYDLMADNKGAPITKVEKMRARETVTKILDSWVRDGIIKGYTEHYRKETKGNVHILESIELMP